MKHLSKTMRSHAALIFIILFLLLLVMLNRQFIKGNRVLENHIQEAVFVSDDWLQLHFSPLTGAPQSDGISNDLHLIIDRTNQWLQSLELGPVDGFFGLEVPFDELKQELSMLNRTAGETSDLSGQIEVIHNTLNDIKSSMIGYRRQLSDGYSYLVQAQVLLIILMSVLIFIALEDRSRQRVKIAGTLRIQDEIVQAQEEERNRIALDLHDDIAQELSWLRMDVAKTENSSERIYVLDSLLYQIRELSNSLRTPDFTIEFFDDAVNDIIDRAERRSPLDVTYLPGTRTPGDFPEIYGHMYRIIQECLNNAVRHAGSSRVFVEIQEEDNFVYLEYRDDGQGFDVEAAMAKGRLGLRGIRNRVYMLGGNLDIESSPGGGTLLRCRLPLASDRRNGRTGDRMQALPHE